MSGTLCGRQAGVTQIEVLIGITLTATMVLGLISLWTLVDDQFQRLQWRQKAVFELNAETARLAALYRYTDFIDDAGKHADDGITLGRWIYRSDPSPSSNPAGMAGLVAAEAKDSDVTAASFGARQILHMDYPGKPTKDTHTNTVWLDRSHLITAELSWSLGDIGLDDCWSGPCYLMTVSLRYPYRLVAGTGPMVDDLGEVQTLTLQTVVGRRASSY